MTRPYAAVFAARSNLRAQRLGVPGHLQANEVAQIGGPCAYCGTWIRIGWDHADPMGRGGPNIIANLVPCCLPCNQRKGIRTASEFGFCVDPLWYQPEAF